MMGIITTTNRQVLYKIMRMTYLKKVSHIIYDLSYLVENDFKILYNGNNRHK